MNCKKEHIRKEKGGWHMYIVIPSYEPDERLIQVVQDVQNNMAAQVIVVDDGSGSSYQHLFQTVEELGAVVLHHEKNKGKGAALKTAFTYLTPTKEEWDVIVTVDSDGQHLIKDIVAIAKEAMQCSDTILLGARAFVGEVPLRSKVGNVITAKLFQLVTREKVTDTQTGLRTMPTVMIPWLLSIEGERFEYEFNMLLEASSAGYRLKEVPIETVYIEENKSSHFRPIQDSFRIYMPFLKFSSTSIISSLVDALLLFTCMALTNQLLFSIVVARLISAGVQCTLNSVFVFHSKHHPLQSIWRYAVLVVLLLACNYVLMNSLISVGVGLMIAKVLTEATLFIASYQLQKNFVFHR